MVKKTGASASKKRSIASQHQTSAKTKKIAKKAAKEIQIIKEQTKFSTNQNEVLTQRLRSKEIKTVESTLLTIAAVSLGTSQDLTMFYNKQLLEELFRKADQLADRTTLYAMDAIRNLYVQAYLMDQPNLAKEILNAGFTQILEGIIDKAMSQLQFEQSKPSPSSQKNCELYKLSIEQALICLRDIFHFIEIDSDKTLDTLTTSSLIQKSIVMCSSEIEKFASIIGIRNLTRCSDFLKELSSDNPSSKSLYSVDLDNFMTSFPVNEESCEFFSNMIVFYTNVIIQKGGIPEVQQRLDFLQQTIDKLFAFASPIEAFQTHFMGSYKQADQFKDAAQKDNKQDQESEILQDENAEEIEEESKADDEDANADKPEFKQWLLITKANTNTLRLLLKIVECVDDDFEGDDDENGDGFEDCMSDEDETNANDGKSEVVIDLDLFKDQLVKLQNYYFPHIIKRAQAIPQLIALHNEAEIVIEELQDAAFTLLANMSYNFRNIIDIEKEKAILDKINQLYELNLYKYQNSSFESASDCLAKLSESDTTRVLIFESNMIQQILKAANYMDQKDTLTILYMLESLQQVLSTNHKKPLVLENENQQEQLISLLINSCKSGDLVLISTALDAFYDICSENFYDLAIIKAQVIEQMQAGLQGLNDLYQQNKKSKTLNKNELGKAENGLINLPEFIKYKQSEFKKLK